VDKAHRKTLKPSSALPEHLSNDCPAIYQGEEKGKATDYLWQNLQLPLYAQAVVLRGEALPTPCYITLGITEEKVKLLEWTGFETADLDSAVACTNWVVGQISAGVFWPPAEKLTHDDFKILAAGRKLPEMVEQA
jgi:ATP-dependent helicase/nuclease subunit B